MTKRIYTTLCMLSLSILCLVAEPYFVRVNDSINYPAIATGQNDFQGRTQYKASNISLKDGDMITCFDQKNSAKWNIAVIDQYGAYENFETTASALKCTKDGLYDIYIKMKYQDDMWYIEEKQKEEGPFYIAGNGKEGSEWCCGKSWSADSCQLGEDNSITFHLPAGDDYQFKITNGTWDKSWGSESVNAQESSSGYSSNSDGNILFALADSGDVTISFVNNTICLKGNFKSLNGNAVPSQCPDVLMQAFFYDSYEVDSTHAGTLEYGDTQWKTLLKQAGEIGAYFDLIWLPPSGYASGVGYHPKQYSNQNSDWGTRNELQTLINTFHNSGTKVVADIVINHAEAMASWCDFPVQNFGKYGVFQPDGSWICNNDEMNWPENNVDTLANECYGTATGAADDGANWDAARDWSHKETKVQEMMKAYLKWMKNEMGYDGWRYDKGDGYNNEHMWAYNVASEPYISFMECWSSNSEITTRIYNSKYNTMALDFQTMYRTFKNGGIENGNYQNCQVNNLDLNDWNAIGLLGCGWKKYAITFVDNHDMFLRNDGEFCGNGNSMKPQNKDHLLQANAYMLSMPGVPCVFYPHWYKYKEYIKDMITARHLAGVHSESEVKDEEVSKSGYKATIVGSKGYLILMLGDKTTHSATGDYKWLADNNYRLIAKGNGYAMWVTSTAETAPKAIVTPSITFENNETGIQVSMQAVGGSCDAPTLYYTTDGTDPTTADSVYTDTLLIKETTTIKVMAVCGDKHSAVQTYTYTYREPLKRGIQVHFQKPDVWNKVCIYSWIPGVDSAGNATSENILGAYPGLQIYPDAEGWYSYEFDLSMDSVNFCINSGNDCGGLNVRSNDLLIDYDTYYTWEEGFDSVSNYEKLLEEKIELNPSFDLVIAPESTNFRSQTEGMTVDLHVVGKKGAMIYYSTDGSDPSTCALPVMDSITLTVKETSTVRAYAFDAADKEKTTEYARTYTYKAPQSGPITVQYFKPHEWQDLYLYAFTRVKKGSRNIDTPYALDGKSSQWPGMKWTTFQQVGSDSVYSFTMKNDIKEIYIIFTEGNRKPQTQDIFLDEDICYVWNPLCGKAVESPNCDGQTPIKEVTDTPYKATKYIENGQLYIVVGEHTYDAFGRKIH